MKRKIFIFLLLHVLILYYFSASANAEHEISARNAILIEQQSGRILYEKKAHEPERIASITKIMTAILAIESEKLNEQVKISHRAEGTEGSSLYLKAGQKMSLEDLVYGLMLRSGNDAAVAIAEHVGGSLEGFVFLMNQKADEIGMQNTHFSNPHGLDDHEDHYSTAYDMAILTKYAMNNDKYREIAGTKVHRAPNPNAEWDYVWKNKNRLTDLYKYATGGKTGYTKRAKRTLVTTAEKGDFEMIAVTLNGPNDWNDHIFLYETGFAQYDVVEILPKGTIENIDEPFYKNKVYLTHEFVYPLTKDEENLIEVKYKFLKPGKDEKDISDIVGKAVVYLDEEKIQESPVYFKHQPEEKQSFFHRFKRIFISFIGVKSHG